MRLYLRVVNLFFLLQSMPITEANHIENSPSLVLIIKIMRHGERTPLYYPPGDPNNYYWKESEGQLTNEGKDTVFQMGKSFRKEYKNFLNELYKPEEIRTLSTDSDRTLMSAESFLAGLYPPKGYQVWHRKIDWQPVPVHILSYNLDAFYANITKAMFALCQAGTQGDLFFNQHKDLIELIQTATGKYYTKCYDLDFFMVLDTFIVEKFYGRTLPFNLDSHYEEINGMKDDLMVRFFGAPAATSGFNGPLLQVYHIPTPKAPRQILQIKGCGHACSLDDFINQLLIASIPQTLSVCPCYQN